MVILMNEPASQAFAVKANALLHVIVGRRHFQGATTDQGEEIVPSVDASASVTSDRFLPTMPLPSAASTVRTPPPHPAT